jgi:hypothetical protein
METHTHYRKRSEVVGLVILGLLAAGTSAQDESWGRMAAQPADPPSNDDCENAIDLTAPGGLCPDLEAGCVVPFSNEGATTDGADHPECPGFGSDIWYYFPLWGPQGRSQSLCGTGSR